MLVIELTNSNVQKYKLIGNNADFRYSIMLILL